MQSDLYTSVDGVLVRDTARTNPKDPSIELGHEFEKVRFYADNYFNCPNVGHF